MQVFYPNLSSLHSCDTSCSLQLGMVPKITNSAANVSRNDGFIRRTKSL